MIEDYLINEDNSARFVLGKYENKPLVIFGINPSIATKDKNDNTISIVEHISSLRKCDGYIMLNLYPLRATKIDENYDSVCNDSISNENLKYIEDRIPEGAEIIAAWGGMITARDYFISILNQINNIVKKKNAKWIALSITKKGHPHHPIRLSYEKMTFEPFDVDNYLSNLSKKKYRI